MDSDTDKLAQQKENDHNLNQQHTEIYRYTDRGPFFVIVEKDDLDPIQLGIKLKRLMGNQILSITRLGEKKARVHTNSYSTANKLLMHGSLFGITDYKVHLPLSFVTSTGIVRKIPTHYQDKEILENITSDTPVLGVERITTWDVQNKMSKPSTSLKVFFRATTIPDRIFIAYNPVKVDLFIQRPLFCRRCLNYGHTVKHCNPKNIALCGNCAMPIHDAEIDCQMKCAICSKNPEKNNKHRTSSSDCPTYKYQYEIKKMMTIKRISFKEAELELRKLNPPVSKPNLQQFLYSQVASSSFQNNPTHISQKSNLETQTTAEKPVNTETQMSNSSESLENGKHLKFILSLINLFQSSVSNGTKEELLLKQIGDSLNEYTVDNKLYTDTDMGTDTTEHENDDPLQIRTNHSSNLNVSHN